MMTKDQDFQKLVADAKYEFNQLMATVPDLDVLEQRIDRTTKSLFGETPGSKMFDMYTPQELSKIQGDLSSFLYSLTGAIGQVRILKGQAEGYCDRKESGVYRAIKAKYDKLSHTEVQKLHKANMVIYRLLHSSVESRYKNLTDKYFALQKVLEAVKTRLGYLTSNQFDAGRDDTGRFDEASQKHAAALVASKK